MAVIWIFHLHKKEQTKKTWNKIDIRQIKKNRADYICQIDSKLAEQPWLKPIWYHKRKIFDLKMMILWL